MAKYIIIPLACSGKGNRVFKNGDIVDENKFPIGAIPELIEKGFIKLYDPGDAAGTVNSAGTAGAVPTGNEGDATGSGNGNPGDAAGATGQKTGIDEWTVKELKIELINRGIPFAPAANKTTLFELLNAAGNTE